MHVRSDPVRRWLKVLTCSFSMTPCSTVYVMCCYTRTSGDHVNDCVERQVVDFFLKSSGFQQQLVRVYLTHNRDHTAKVQEQESIVFDFVASRNLPWVGCIISSQTMVLNHFITQAFDTEVDFCCDISFSLSSEMASNPY